MCRFDVAGELALELLESTKLPGAVRVQKAKELLEMARDGVELPIEEIRRLLGHVVVASQALQAKEVAEKFAKEVGLNQHVREKLRSDVKSRKERLREAEEAWQGIMKKGRWK